MTIAKDISGAGATGRGGWVHFAIAAGILAATAIGFEWTITALKLVTEKKAIPWPAGTTVDPNTFRLENLPTEVDGRFVLVADGELPGVKNGDLPDGEIFVNDTEMEILGMGTDWDRARISERRSNWYIVRLYRDKTKPANHPLLYWRLEVYYYTGALDTVPHVPERCLVVGGATLVDSADTILQVPQAPGPWGEPLAFRRTLYEVSDRRSSGVRQFVQYYLFSLNGKPESSWEKVRLGLTSPFLRYCYFAKVQFAPLGEVTDVGEADRAAGDLMNCFLPIVLRNLPTPEDIEALKAIE